MISGRKIISQSLDRRGEREKRERGSGVGERREGGVFVQMEVWKEKKTLIICNVGSLERRRRNLINMKLYHSDSSHGGRTEGDRWVRAQLPKAAATCIVVMNS